MSFAGDVHIETDKLKALRNLVALEVIDKSAREIGFEVLRRALVYLEQQVYTRPNVQVTAEKMPYVPEPTGALWNSGYLRTYTGELPPGAKTEAEATSSARAKNKEVVLGQSPPGPSRLGQVQVLFAVEYAIYVEMGTVWGMLPRSYLVRSAEEVQEFVEDYVVGRLRMAGFDL